MRLALIIAVALIAGPVYAAPPTWLQEQTGNMHRTSGPFINHDYGFSIEAPREASEYVTNGGDANHGVVLILGDRREIVVYPEYTGFVPGDAEPCRRHQFPWEVASKTLKGTGELDGQNVCVLTFINGDVIRRAMQATGNDRGTGIMYTLLLTTTPQWSHTDFFSLQHVEDSFRRVPIVRWNGKTSTPGELMRTGLRRAGTK